MVRSDVPRSLAALLAAGLVLAAPVRAAERIALAHLAGATHFHGLAVDPADGARLLLATHHGLFAVTPDGMATRLSETGDDFMGFTPDPADAGRLYASGHPAEGGNLGVIVSTDGGRSWRPLAAGVHGPVDFHQMAASGSPHRLYGAYAGTLQASRDGGLAWQLVGPAPEGLIALAASAAIPERLYAATRVGLLVSDDGGRSFREAMPGTDIVSTVRATPEGRVYAFVVGRGLLAAEEATLEPWKRLDDGLGERILLHLAQDPARPERLVAVTQENEILESADGGRTWRRFGGG